MCILLLWVKSSVYACWVHIVCTAVQVCCLLILCVFYLLFKIGYWNLLLLLHCCQFLLSDLSILVLYTRCSDLGCMYIYNCYIFLLNLSFYHCVMIFFLALEAVFDVKSASSDLNITTPFFWLSFVGNIFFFLRL